MLSFKRKKKQSETVKNIIIATDDGICSAIKDIRDNRPDLALVTLETVEPFLHILVKTIKEV